MKRWGLLIGDTLFIGVGGKSGGGEVKRWGLLLIGDTFMGVEDSDWVEVVGLSGDTAGVDEAW